MLRLAALVSLLAGLAAFFVYLGIMGLAPWSSREMKHLRAMKDRTSAPANPFEATTVSFEDLPHRRPLAEYAALERRGVRMEGYVQRMLRAPDGDTHLELVATPRLPGGPDTLYVTAEVTPPMWRGSERWSYASLLALFRPNRGGRAPWPGGPSRVRLTGWLLYDWQYDGEPSPWQKEHAAPRATGWEIHPVTKIERWNDADSAWVEVPR